MENNWTIGQTQELFGLVCEFSAKGQGLSSAFALMAERCGRSINSVRNYYYSQLKMFQLVPTLARDLNIEVVGNRREQFQFFTNAEIESLVESVLTGKAAGRSVRAVIAELANGDSKQALRLQNKYRSMIAHHKPKILEIMGRLKQQNIPYFDPYKKHSGQNNIEKLSEYIKTLEENEELVRLIKSLL